MRSYGVLPYLFAISNCSGRFTLQTIQRVKAMLSPSQAKWRELQPRLSRSAALRGVLERSQSTVAISPKQAARWRAECPSIFLTQGLHEGLLSSSQRVCRSPLAAAAMKGVLRLKSQALRSQRGISASMTLCILRKIAKRRGESPLSLRRFKSMRCGNQSMRKIATSYLFSESASTSKLSSSPSLRLSEAKMSASLLRSFLQSASLASQQVQGAILFRMCFGRLHSQSILLILISLTIKIKQTLIDKIGHFLK